MTLVRRIQAADIAEVASLYKKTFLRKRGEPAQELCAYLREFYCDGPFRDPDIGSLVHVNDDGAISGFVGVHSVPYLIGERTVRAAFCGALMSSERERDPLAGARLLKAFLGGPQDISFSETAIPRSQAMWAKLRGTTIGPQSLDWFRILKPAGFLLASAARRAPPLVALKPVARIADRVWGGRCNASGLAGLKPEPAPAGLVTETVNLSEFATVMRRFSEGFAARPDWGGGYLEHVLRAACDKPLYGEPVMAVVRLKCGETLGGFLYHAAPGQVGRVLQVVAMPGRGAIVLDRLFADALQRGAVGLRGRSQPWIIQVAPSRGMIFMANAASVVLARDPSLADPFLSGDCVINGLAGETWNRFFGGKLD